MRKSQNNLYFSHIEVLADIVNERKEYFDKFIYYAKKIKTVSTELLSEEPKVIIFGSVVSGAYTPLSDIDVLVISDKFHSLSDEEKRIIRTKVKTAVGRFSPFQIHIATTSEFSFWWKKFIHRYIEI
ncbi:MAG: nucleotidyltransferase domain-containing protein [Elusimicrobiota bacterium]|nr:nucleotidyltransferase domain-containing protein [Endomicrobiia bacterium]MDW8166479.1 nucleotidyltransferase domain-containing protein [Elusimicrobiota bacterium]